MISFTYKIPLPQHQCPSNQCSNYISITMFSNPLCTTTLQSLVALFSFKSSSRAMKRWAPKYHTGQTTGLSCMIKCLYFMDYDTLNLQLQLSVRQRDGRAFYLHRLTALLLLYRMNSSTVFSLRWQKVTAAFFIQV